MKSFEDLIALAGINSLMAKKEDEQVKKVLWILAIIGAVAVVAGIAVAVYRYLSPDYLDDIEDEFEDDFFDDDDDDEDDEDEEEETAEEPAAEEPETEESAAE